MSGASGPVVLDPDTVEIRAPLARARERAWRHLASPGTWWSGAERVALVAAAREARRCRLCAARRAALSPYGVDGEHDHDGRPDCALPAPAVELAHRLRSDAGRLTRRWYEDLRAAGLGDGHYVEAVAVVAIATALDTFDEALGLDERALPEPAPGAPSRRRPARARTELAWVATVAPGAFGEGEVDPYAVHGEKHIHQALSLVPDEVMAFFDLDVELYLKDHEIRDFDTEHRALGHAQIELVAGRVSALNGCFY